MWKRLIDGAQSLIVTPAVRLTALPSSQYQSAHLDKNIVPMKLCDLCSKLNIDLLSKHGQFWNDTFEHQPGFTALETSASTGCEMCSMFLQCVTKEYCAKENCSPEKAHQIFRNAETHGKAPCLMEPKWSGDGIGEVVYSIPYTPNKDPMGWNHHLGTSAQFALSNYGPVFEDSGISRMELAPMPDFSIARRWIEECTSNHQRCSTEHISQQTAKSKNAIIKVPFLPTRVLDVGFGRGEEPRLLISGNRRAQYIALSHCWGKVRPLVTESSNLLQHLESIPLLSMPKTFQDAVIATRELGIQYLWIDCLCIIQDSSQDWERECSSMAHIYQSSTVTICGSHASDSCAGFLHTRSSPQPVPCHWMYRNSKWGKLKTATLRHLDGSDTYPRFTELTAEESASPLQQRGWILQESLLSPRLLFFGLYRMYWECNTHTQFENFPTSQEPSDGRLHCSVRKADFMPFELSSEFDQWKEWCSVVQEYSLRSITMPVDKLPALSGMADWLLSGRGDIYLAGLLKHALHAGLTWHICRESDGRPPVSGYRGPSWSWVSTDYPVILSAIPPVRPRIARSNEDKEARRRNFALTSQKTKLQVHDAHVKLRGQNLFGEVKSGSIRLRGRVKKGKVLYQTKNTGHSFTVCDSILSEKSIGNFYPDDIDWWDRLASEKQDVRDLKHGFSSMPGTDVEDVFPYKTHAEKPFDSSIPNEEVECLCIDVFERGWLGLVIEPLSHNPFLLSRSGSAPKTEEDTYKPYRRIGALNQYTNSDWFEDGEWKLIELF